jgi:YidC/Oxa1 family membrane protein insertase
MIGEIFHAFVYQPLLNSLIFLYQTLPFSDLGLAVISLTVLVRIVVLPLNLRSARLQKGLQRLQPKIKEIQQNYKDNSQEQARLTAALFKSEKINPLTSFWPLMIQLPILLALYQLFWQGLWQPIDSLVINPVSFGLLAIDLSAPSSIFALAAGLAQWLQSQQTGVVQTAAKAPASKTVAVVLQKEMLFLFPLITILILWGLPSALALYWLTSSLLAVTEQKVFLKVLKND